MQSESIGKLATALAAAQAVMKAPTKGRTAKVEKDGKLLYSYKYADLADVIECFREPLSKNGLALAQTMTPVDGHLVMTTRLLHSSGEWLASEYPIAAYARPQEQGSAITYARRYAVSALLGIAAEDDDDGAGAQAGAERREEEDPPGYTLPPDAVAILKLAVEIRQYTGEEEDAIIERGSEFNDKDGQRQFFRDPRSKLRNPKWLASTRKRMEKEAHELRAKAEPGAAEAAAAFTSGLETCPKCDTAHPPSKACAKAAAA